MAAPSGNTNNNKFKPQYPYQVYKLCLLGARDRDIADFFKVHRDTIFNWVTLYPEFAEARKRGKLAADAEVAHSLFTSAMGATLNKQKVLSSGDIIDYQERLPPDVRAAEYWLKCRSRDKWNQKNQIKLVNDQTNPLAFLLADTDNSLN